MTPAEVTELRERLWLNKAEFGRALSTHTRTVYRWEQGALAPKGAVEAVMVAMRGALASWPDRAEDLASLVRDASRRGGLAWLLERLLFDWLAEAKVRE